MIQFPKSFTCSDGNVYETLALAQEHELVLIMKSFERILSQDHPNFINNLARNLVLNSAKIVDILTTKTASKPKARAINGGKKTRKSSSSVLTQETKLF